jgi:hypothetical protein
MIDKVLDSGIGGSDAVDVSGLSRRDLLRRGAKVGAVAVWTIPIIQVVSMTPAHAESASQPSSENNPPPLPPPGGGTSPTVKTQTGGVLATGPVSVTNSPPLAFTGSSTGPAALVGAGALAVGAGLVAAAQIARKRDDSAPDDLVE